MSGTEKAEAFARFNDELHILGRAGLAILTAMLVGAPFAIGWLLGAPPDLKGFLSGFAKVGGIYIPVAIVEFLVFAPMLGVGGSYLAFITGNLANLKVPCAVNARDLTKTEAGSAENEIVSTLSVATSALVTTLVVFAGVMLLAPLEPVLASPALRPAFDNVVPALFGALGLKYFIRGRKIALIPLIVMSALCILVPGMIRQTSLLLIPAGGLAILIAWLRFRRGTL